MALIVFLSLPGLPCAWAESAIVIQDVRSSGFLPADRLNTYYPRNLFDSDLKTLWCESSPEDGVGEYIRVTFAAATPIDQVYIWNGYGDPGYFKKNNRVCIVQVDVDREFCVLAQLEDTSAMQSIRLPHVYKATEITFTILAVYRGEKWNDTCISELGFAYQGLPIKTTFADGYKDYFEDPGFSKRIEHWYDAAGIEYKRITEEFIGDRLLKRISEYRASRYRETYQYENGLLIKYDDNSFDKCAGSIGYYDIEYEDGRISVVTEHRDTEEDVSYPIIHKYTYCEFGVAEILSTKNGIEVIRETNQYNRLGLIQRKETQYNDGRAPSTVTYSYTGNRLTRTERTSNQGESIVSPYEYAGDRLSRVVNEPNRGEDLHFYYDRQGVLIFRLSVDRKGKPGYIESYIYNADGFLRKKEQYSFWYYSDTEQYASGDSGLPLTGKLYYGLNYQYDIFFEYDAGKLVKRESGGHVTTYEYDSEGRLVEECLGVFTRKSSFDIDLRIRYSYQEGRTSQAAFTREGRDELHKYSYDIEGKLVREIIYDESGQYLGSIVIEYR